MLVFFFCVEVCSQGEEEFSPVIITGSNIPTVELEGPSPIVRIDREEINRSGAETVGELLRRLPDMEYATSGPVLKPSALVRTCSEMQVRYTPERKANAA